METENLTQQSLYRWVQITSGNTESKLRTTDGNLSGMKTGPCIDQEANFSGYNTITVRLSDTRPTAQRRNQRVMIGEAHIEDVPGDGSCGFHAIYIASKRYDGSTFFGKDMPSTQQESRFALLQFIRDRRRDIENVVVNSVGLELSRHYLWRDVHGTQGSSSHCTHAELCENVLKDGMSGHWLGSGIGEAEIHLLGRVLGVTVHCVMAASDEKKGSCLRQTFGASTCLWTGALRGTPKGAVVIRFMGGYDTGHYQIVNYGREPGKIPLSHKPKHRNHRKRKRSIDINEEEIERDLAAVDHMHGVQPQTKSRYFTNYCMVDRAFCRLRNKHIDPLDLENNGSQVLKAIMAVLLQRCGPKEKGYENLSAKATGKVILAAVASWYKDHGKSFNENHITVLSGRSVRGPPSKAQKVLDFKQTLLKLQAKSRTVLERKAYQLTHDDVAAAMRYFVAKQLGQALDPNYSPGSNPNVSWLQLQVSLMVVAAFGPGCRGAEMTNILLGDLRFLYEGSDATIGATLYGVKSKNGERAIRRIVFPTWSDTCVISPAFAVMTQIALVHGLPSPSQALDSESPLFPNIHRNQVLRGQRMPADTYNSTLKHIFYSLGITDNATEHSPRRGGSGFRFYVLGEHPNYIRDILGHANTTDALNYIGFDDPESSYVMQGYGTCGSKKIR